MRNARPFTGDMHRSEFCIPRCTRPISTTGRLDLLKLRAFVVILNAGDKSSRKA